MQALGPRRQSTLIAFKGTAETAGSVGDTDPALIDTFFRSALKNKNDPDFLEDRGRPFHSAALRSSNGAPASAPPLGATSLMAARGEDLAQFFLTMTAFGLGRPRRYCSSASCRVRSSTAGRTGCRALATSQSRIRRRAAGDRIAIVAGVDKQLEAALVEASRPGEPDHAFLPPSGTTVMPVRLSAPVAGFAG
ncbi:hypothetical protein [Sinorhizobium meliloti]|uniref:hypothetical protein n=1 Tax=Rhizobium meliloti TaxID=382 RepID=UPI001F1EFD70|nr:hypothetical protein [Sinorhizobium meliloti]